MTTAARRLLKRLFLFVRGWVFWVRAVYLSVSKEHGAGGSSWQYARYAGDCTRFIIYGQHYPTSWR
jgi:hypothetical protein